MFQSATKAAARARNRSLPICVDLGGIAVEADIKISLKNIDEKGRDEMSGPVTRSARMGSCDAAASVSRS